MTDEIMEMNDAVEVETGNAWLDIATQVAIVAGGVFVGELLFTGAAAACKAIGGAITKAGEAMEAKKAEKVEEASEEPEKVEAEVVEAPAKSKK